MNDNVCKGNIYFLGTSNYSEDFPTAEEVGFKALNLMKMHRANLPVPAGFVLCTHFCRQYLTSGNCLPQRLVAGMRSFIKHVENSTGLIFEGTRNPLLLSVRSGAAVSMPGMLETILNVGLGESTINALIRMTGNPRFAWDSYRRLVQTYCEVVQGCPPNLFETQLNEFLASEKIPDIRELDVNDLKNLSNIYLSTYEKYTGAGFPQEPSTQLMGAIAAVFKSWESPKAVEYRKLHKLNGLIGTALIIQAMVFGNMGASSGSGVGFTRDPSTGENRLYIDFLLNSQGEDIVSGRSLKIPEGSKEKMRDIYTEIHEIKSRLENMFKDMQDFEFTVQQGKLYILQTRTGKRTPWAALKIATDLVNEGLIDRETALKRLEDYDLKKIERIRLSRSDIIPLCTGISANNGVAIGQIVLDSELAVKKGSWGLSLILVRDSISTDDIAGIAVSKGILTNKGGRTSHAAVVARQMDKVCIVGCRAITIDFKSRSLTVREKVLREGDLVTLDGNTGTVYHGKVDVTVENPTEIIQIIEEWKNQRRH